MQPIFVYITCSDRAEAHKIGREMVERRLAACANILDGMESIYWWEGKMDTAREAVLILKSQEAHLETLIAAVKSAHSYTVPCIVALPIKGGNPDYLAWIAQMTAG